MAIRVRPFRPDDAARIAGIVQRCLREMNSRDHPAHIIGKMCAYSTAERFIELSVNRLIHAAEDTEVVGTVSRDGDKVYPLFVDPDSAGRGTGRQLMEHIEILAGRDGYNSMETGAGITAHRFYLRLGYTDVRESGTEFGLDYILRKPLLPAAGSSNALG